MQMLTEMHNLQNHLQRIEASQERATTLNQQLAQRTSLLENENKSLSAELSKLKEGSQSATIAPPMPTTPTTKTNKPLRPSTIRKKHRAELNRVQEVNMTSNFHKLDADLASERHLINNISSLQAHIHTKKTHIEAPWKQQELSMATKFASVKQVMASEICPRPSQNALFRTVLTSVK